MHKIVWLASYPKSGNTWTRAILSNLMLDPDNIDINALNTDGIASSRKWFDTSYLFNSALLTNNEADALRPKLYIYTANIVKRLLYVKTHDAAFNVNTTATPMFPAEATFGAVYIIRNPLDVVVSLDNHNAITIEEAVKCMNSTHYSLAHSWKRLNNQLRQKLGNWSEHVQSWVERTDGINLLIIRYEDLLYDGINTVTKLAQFANLPANSKLIADAVANSAFENLKAQEQTTAFKEKPVGASSFFREGKSGGWRKHLNDRQMQMIITKHSSVMHRFGYLDNLGNPIF